jgi:hypothetical protein
MTSNTGAGELMKIGEKSSGAERAAAKEKCMQVCAHRIASHRILLACLFVCLFVCLCLFCFLSLSWAVN